RPRADTPGRPPRHHARSRARRGGRLMRALRYAFDEAILSLWRGRQSGALSTATITLALFVLGAFLIATSNLERLGREWNNSAELSVYLADSATPAQQAAIDKTLGGAGVVASRQYLSKGDA